MTPAELLDGYRSGSLGYFDTAMATLDAWTYATQHVEQETWLGLFRELAFLTSIPGLRSPVQAPEQWARLRQHKGRFVVFRGSFPEHVRGLSWTPDPHVAAYFAGSRAVGEPDREEVLITTGLVPPKSVLAALWLDADGDRPFTLNHLIVEPDDVVITSERWCPAALLAAQVDGTLGGFGAPAF